MLINELLLIERVLNLTTPDDKQKYGKEVWDLLQKAYAPIGGFLSAPNVEALINDSGMWKLVRRGDSITAANIYKDSHGRKSIASATNGERQGKSDFIMMKDEDIKHQRSWSEVSGAIEKILQRSGSLAIPAKYAELLTGKEILGYNTDGLHYTRIIAGEPHEKIIFGFVEVDDKLLAKLKDAGISVKELPSNFKPKK